MELSRKTTILLSPTLHDCLTRLALQTGRSMGQLIREACEQHYGFVSRGDRVAAVREIASLRLPVGTPEQMKAESVPLPLELP